MSSVATVEAVPQASVREKSAATSLLVGLMPWVGYIAATLFLLRALLPVGGDHLPGLTDGWQNLWNTWWMRYALLDLHTNPWFSDYIYYPNGSSLLFHTYAPLNGVLALPFTVTLGPLVTTNLLIIGSFVWTGMAAYALGRGLGLGRFEAWLAGATYTFCNPARWQYFGGGQADHLAMQWMPLYILCLVKATGKEYVSDPAGKLPWKWLIGAIVFYAANALTDWQFFVYMSFFSFLYAIYLLIRAGSGKERLITIRNLAIIAGGTVLVLSPLLFFTVREALNPAYAIEPPLWQTVLHSYDLTAYITPNRSNPLWGGWALAQGFVNNREANIPGLSNTGYIPLALAVVGLVFYARRMLHWAIFGLIFAVMSLGPILHVGGVDTGVPGPYNLLLEVPFVNISRDPSRFSLTAFLCVGLLAGFGWTALRERVKLPVGGRAARYAAMALLAVATVGEFSAIAYPITTWRGPRLYYELAKDPEPYALAEMPVADKFFTEYAEAMEHIHHKKIMGGQTARKPCYCFPMETPVFRWFWDLSIPDTPDIVRNPDPASYAPAIVRYFNFRYIVIYRWMLTETDYELANGVVRQMMPEAESIEDNGATIYTVPNVLTTTVMPILLKEGWEAPEPAGEQGVQRWLQTRPVSFVVVNATHSPRTATLDIDTVAFYEPRTLRI